MFEQTKKNIKAVVVTKNKRLQPQALNNIDNLGIKQLQIARSKCFGGQLNKSWVNKDLYRYELNFSQLTQITFCCTAATELKVEKKLTNGSTTHYETLSTAAGTNAKYKLGYSTQSRTHLPFGCLHLDKIILHSSSGKFIQAPSNSAIVDLAFSTISCQTPAHVYSRKSIAGFKLTKSALLGAKTTLRALAKLEFYYKWYFLGASVPKIAPMSFSRTIFDSNMGSLTQQAKGSPVKNALSSSLAIQNIFVFTELDRLDYDSFSTMSGFEIYFVSCKAISDHTYPNHKRFKLIR
jgi:ribosomal protein L5